MSQETFDVVVIGGGPGGYVAAIRAAQLGGKVALVEKGALGGVCLNRGCIPTKAMLACADLYDTVKNKGKNFGITIPEATLDYPAVITRRQKVVKTLVGGVGMLMKKNKIQVFNGIGKLTSANAVEVELTDGAKETISTKNVIIATGSEPVKVPIPGLDGENVWDSDGALAANEVPKSMLVIGAGAIGLEWGYMFNKFGCKVTIVELMPQILPLNDAEIAAELRKTLKKSGIDVLTEHKVVRVEKGADGEMVAAIVPAEGGDEKLISAEKILVAVGRRSVSEGLGLEGIGVTTDRGRITVNDKMQTNVPGIYAIGDVVGGMLLAHKASEEGVVAAENAMGHAAAMNYKAVPAIVYTSPEVASVGITEAEATKQGIAYKVGKFSYRANGKALGAGETEGMVKIIADEKYGEILGCHIVGPHASDQIHEIVIAMETEGTIETVARAIHGHPTLSEVVKEAALDASLGAIHKA